MQSNCNSCSQPHTHQTTHCNLRLQTFPITKPWALTMTYTYNHNTHYNISTPHCPNSTTPTIPTQCYQTTNTTHHHSSNPTLHLRQRTSIHERMPPQHREANSCELLLRNTGHSVKRDNFKCRGAFSCSIHNLHYTIQQQTHTTTLHNTTNTQRCHPQSRPYNNQISTRCSVSPSHLALLSKTPSSAYQVSSYSYHRAPPTSTLRSMVKPPHDFVHALVHALHICI